MTRKLLLFSAVAGLSLVHAAPVLPGYLTDPSVMKGSMAKDTGYQTPARFKYPYISTYYVKPTVRVGEPVKIDFFVTDFDSSKIRFLDDSHRFTVHLEYGLRGAEKRIVDLKGVKSGDAAFELGALPAGDYEMRIWAVDAKGRESHRVIHDFRVVDPEALKIPAGEVYRMTEADLAAYGIRNDGDFERIVYVETNGTSKVVKEKRAGVPGYTVTVPMDPKTGKMPWQAFKVAKVDYDEGYDKALVETNAVLTADGIQKLIDEKSAAGIRKLVMLPGTYRISHQRKIVLPDRFTLDLGKAVLKQNAFTGASSLMVNLASTVDSHLIGGTLEGDYWTHDYAGSPNNSEWPAGFQIGGDSWYSSVEGVRVADITGYGGQNGISKDAKGNLAFCLDWIGHFTPGGLDPRTGNVDTKDKYRFTSELKSLRKITDLGRRRIQVSKYLGYQGRATRSWQVTVAWYNGDQNFISAETCWQYREMWIPEKAAYIRVSVEEESVEAADKAGLCLTAMRLPVNCAVRKCTFDRCRCVGYAASAMKNFLFEGNFFTWSGESAARCAFDAEDGWDQMQDVYFYKNVFRDNPMNNSILTCAGHNFILEKNEGDIYFWGRTHSPCVRNSTINSATYRCDSRLRSGYGRFENNTYLKGVNLGENEGKNRTDNWDYVLSGLEFDGEENAFTIDVGNAGRIVNCHFKNMAVSFANAYACTFENCTDGSSYKAFPGGNWYEVTLKNCKFNRFYNTNNWDRCHFVNTKLNGFSFGRFTAKDCDFTDSSIFGLRFANIRMVNCKLDRMTVQGNWWEHPADLLFKNCTITTTEANPFLKLAGYTIGKVGFDGCTVSGRQPLVNVHDLRRIQLPPNTPPEKDPDNKAGTIALRGTKWKSESPKVLIHENNRNPSPKRIVILNKDNAWPDDVEVATDLPPTWELK